MDSLDSIEYSIWSDGGNGACRFSSGHVHWSLHRMDYEQLNRQTRSGIIEPVDHKKKSHKASIFQKLVLHNKG